MHKYESFGRLIRFSDACLTCKSHANVYWPVIFNVIRGHGWIRDAVVDDSVDTDGDRIPRQHLLGWHVEGNRSQVDLLVTVRTGNDEKYTRPLGSPCKKRVEEKKKPYTSCRVTLFLSKTLYSCRKLNAMYKGIHILSSKIPYFPEKLDKLESTRF